MAELTYEKPFFYGSSINRLNTKGQVAIPKRFRDVVAAEELEKGFVLVRGEAECIYMYTHREFGAVKERVRGVARESGDAEFFRLFMASAQAVDLDSQGRFVLAEGLRREAGIAGPEVLFIGVDDRIEIWEPTRRAADATEQAAYEVKRAEQARRIFGI